MESRTLLRRWEVGTLFHVGTRAPLNREGRFYSESLRVMTLTTYVNLIRYVKVIKIGEVGNIQFYLSFIYRYMDILSILYYYIYIYNNIIYYIIIIKNK